MFPVVLPGALSIPECNRVMELADAVAEGPAKLSVPKENYRSGAVRWLPRCAESVWLFERVGSLFTHANRRYGLELTGLFDELQVAMYGPGDKFQWHVDIGTGEAAFRKLTVAVQLTPLADYRGGRLEFCPGGELPFSGLQGSAVVFPAYTAHRVTPLTGGQRRSLVAWAKGPPLR